MSRLFSRNPKDLGAGALYVAFGATAILTARRYPFGSGSEMGPGYFPTILGAILIVIARRYPFGSGSEMGPGYFPTVLGAILILIGSIAILRALLRDGGPIGLIAWRPLALIVGGTALFALLLPRLGLAVALPALALLSAAASRHFGWDWRAALGLVALTVVCVAVFIVALGVQMPLVGAWLPGG